MLPVYTFYIEGGKINAIPAIQIDWFLQWHYLLLGNCSGTLNNHFLKFSKRCLDVSVFLRSRGVLSNKELLFHHEKAITSCIGNLIFNDKRRVCYPFQKITNSHQRVGYLSHYLCAGFISPPEQVLYSKEWM